MVVNEDRQKFETKWQRRVDKIAELSRWQPAVLGAAVEDYRQTPVYKDMTKALIRAFSSIKKEAHKQGLTLSDFWDAVRKKAKEESTIAITKDQTEFYSQTEAETEDKRPSGSRSEKNKIHLIFRNALRRIGWMPLGVRGEWKEEKVSKLGKKLKANDYPETNNKILGLNLELINIDLELQSFADKIKKEKVKLAKTTEEDEKLSIKNEITAIRKDVGTKTTERMAHLEKLQKEEEKMNLMISLIQSELEIEGKIIQRKWGNQVEQLTNKKQRLLDSLDDATKGTDTAYQNRLRTEIRKIDMQLVDIRKKVVKYKAKWPIFLFERFAKVQSIPLLKALETITPTKAKHKAEKPPHRIPEKDVEPEPEPPEDPDDVEGLRRRIAELEAENAELKVENESLTDANRELNTMYSALEAKNKELIAKIAELENKLIEEEEINQKLREDIKEMAAEIANLKEILKDNKLRIAALAEANKKLADDLAILMEDKEGNEGNRQEIERLTQALAESEESKRLLEEQLTKATKALSTSEEQLALEIEETKKLSELTDELRAQIDKFAKSEEQLALEIKKTKKLSELTDELRAQIDKFAKQLKAERKDKDKALGDKFNLEQQMVDYEELKQEAADKQVLNQENEALNDRLKETEQTLEDVRSLMAKMEGNLESTQTELSDIKGVNRDMSEELASSSEKSQQKERNTKATAEILKGEIKKLDELEKNQDEDLKPKRDDTLRKLQQKERSTKAAAKILKDQIETLDEHQKKQDGEDQTE